MSDRPHGDERRELLALLERHWTKLTLGEARSLCVDSLDRFVAVPNDIKDSLTYR